MVRSALFLFYFPGHPSNVLLLNNFLYINKSDIEEEFKHTIAETSLTIINLHMLFKIVGITGNLNYQSCNITCKIVKEKNRNSTAKIFNFS